MLRENYAAEIEGFLRRFPNKKSAVLPLMHLAQQEYGYLSQEAMTEVADILELDPTHILSLAGFYTLYYEEPEAKYILEVCNDLACALRGADAFLEMVCDRLGIPVNGRTEDGLFAVKPVMCLGACDRAPMLQCNLKFAENLDEARFDELIARLRREDEAGASEPSVVQKIMAYARPE